MEYRIIYVDLPCHVHGITKLRSGFYNVYINARLSYEEQQKAIRHELSHILRDDMYKQDEPLSKIETM